MVTLLSNTKGEIYASCQLQDYLHRAPEMEHCSLLAFAIDTWEETYNNENETEKKGSPTLKAGCPAHIRACYDHDHPRWHSHRRVFRAFGHNTLPHIAGPWFPHNNDANLYNFYCACMLALLKPWHKKEHLKSDDEPWHVAFMSFKNNATTYQKRVIAGFQYYYKSKVACDSMGMDGDKLSFGRRCAISTVECAEEEETADTLENESRIPLTEQDLQMFK